MFVVLSAKDFNGKNVQKAKNTGGLLLVKADWCGHCKKLKVVLDKLSKKLNKAYPIFVLDADKDMGIISSLKVDGYPTVFFIDRNGDIKEKYNSDRTEGAFLSEICRVSLVCKK